MPTFTPGDTVPPTGVIGSSANLNDDALGTDITPAGWPTTGKATAVEVELTVTDAFSADGQVQVGISPPGSLASQVAGLSDAGGTFSGADGSVDQYRSGGTEAFFFDKFGGWRTEYVTHGASGTTSNRIVHTSTESPSGGFDIRAKVRAADWDSGPNGVICTSTTSLGSYYNRMAFDSSGLFFNTVGGPFWRVPLSSLSLTDGEWTWFRISYTGGDGYAYQSTDGSSWSLVDTKTSPGWSTYLTTTLNIGATNENDSGLDGDIAEVIVYDGHGDLIHDLALDAMGDSEERSWVSPVGSVYDNLPTGSRATGETISDTARVRLDFDAPIDMDDWRLIIDAQTGDVTVDEILLEVERASTGWKVGFL